MYKSKINFILFAFILLILTSFSAVALEQDDYKLYLYSNSNLTDNYGVDGTHESYFNGIDDYISTQAFTNTLASDWSVSFKGRALNNGILLGSSTTDYQYIFLQDSTDSVDFYFGSSHPVSMTELSDDTTITMTMTSGGFARIYQDGVNIANLTMANTYYLREEVYYIGKYRSDALYLKGEVDELVVTTDILSLNEINGLVDGSISINSLDNVEYGLALEDGVTKFDGVDDYIDTNIDLDSNTFSYNLWLRTSESEAYRGIIGDMETNPSPYGGTILKTDDSGNGYAQVLAFNSDKSVSVGVTGSTTKINDNALHMLTVTYDGVNLKLYTDGVLDATSTSITIGFTNNNIQIGRDVDQLGRNIEGDFKKVVITSDVLIPTEITNLFNKIIVNDDLDNVVYQNDMTSFSDLSKTTFETEVIGGVSTKYDSFKFDNINDVISISDIDQYEEVITYKVWINGYNLNSIDIIMGQSKLDSSNFHGIYLDLSGVLKFQVFSSTITSNGSILSTNTWYHIVAIVDSLNNMLLYVDGVLVAEGIAVWGSSDNGNLIIGKYGLYDGHYFDGELQGISVINKVLNSTEILNDYNKGHTYNAFEIVEGLSGSGSELNPYELSSCNDFNFIQDNPNSYYEVINNIDFTPCNPRTTAYVETFKGYLNGNEYTLSNIVMNFLGGSYEAFFAENMYGGEINNLKFEAVDISGGSSVHGFLIGSVDSPISNTHTYITNVHINNITSTDDNVGFMVGHVKEYEFLHLTNSSITNTFTNPVNSNDVNIYFVFRTSSIGSYTYIDNCKATGVSNNGFIEAFGYDYDNRVVINNSYVNITRNGGSLYSLAHTQIIKNSYSVSDNVVTHFGTGVVEDSSTFYNSELDNIDCSTTTLSGTCSNTTAMTSVKTYLDAGWDFDDVWGVTSTNSYPCLLWEDDCVDYLNYAYEIDLLFSNTSSFEINKSFFKRFEPVYYAINFTNIVIEEPDENATCEFVFYDPVEFKYSGVNNFSLCDSGCDYDNYSQEFNFLETMYVSKDVIEFEVCHTIAPVEDFNISYSCGGNAYDFIVTKTQIPLCDDEDVVQHFEFEDCINFASINITVSNSAVGYNQGHKVSNGLIGRVIINKTVSTDNVIYYNDTLSMYLLDHVHYYITDGVKRVDASCMGYNITSNITFDITKDIVIANIAPYIYMEQLYTDCGHINESGEINYCTGDWVFMTPVIDENPINVYYNLSCNSDTGFTYNLIQNVSYSQWVSDGIVIDSTNFINFTDSMFCNFDIGVMDSYNRSYNVTANFTVIDNIQPNCIGIEEVLTNQIGTIDLNITCFDERLINMTVECSDVYNPTLSSSQLSFSESANGESSIVLEDSIFLYGLVVCQIEVYDYIGDKYSFAKIITYDVDFDGGLASEILYTNNYNSTLKAGECPTNNGSLAILFFMMLFIMFLMVLGLLFSSPVMSFFAGLLTFIFAWSIAPCSVGFGVMLAGIGLVCIIIGALRLGVKGSDFE